MYGCEGSSLEISCKPDEYISTIRANYGRLADNICNNINTSVRSWSTRCVQPTSLRSVVSVCGEERSECSVQVSDHLFGDPCPNTPKYLELVYTCKTRVVDSVKTRGALQLPPWLLSLETMTDIIMEKNLQKQESTTSSPSTTSSSSSPPIRYSADKIRRPSKEFLEYIEQVEKTKKKQRLRQFLNQPQMIREPAQSREAGAEDTTIIVAVVCSVGLMVCMISFTILLLALRNRRTRPDSVSDEVESSETSDAVSTTSTYLQYSVTGSTTDYTNLVMDAEGRVYQVIPHHQLAALLRTSQLSNSNNEYEDVDQISVLT